MKMYLILLTSILLIILQFSCKDNSTQPEPPDDDTSGVIVRKPNIYIYPTEDLNLYVSINFPSRGKIIESIPKYNDLWNIFVNPSGLINGEYDFLYYECSVPDLFQKNSGWIIKKENLKSFFSENMLLHNFNSREIKDFIDYWIPILVSSEYYEIYPQYSPTINSIVNIDFSNSPNNFFRLFYLIKERSDNKIELLTPEIELAVRKQFYVIEWGVILHK